jgi:hypothetical protein
LKNPTTIVATGKSTTLKNPLTMVTTGKSTKQTSEQTTDHNLFCPILTRNVQSHKLLAQLSHFALLEHATYHTHKLKIAINNLCTSKEHHQIERNKIDDRQNWEFGD